MGKDNVEELAAKVRKAVTVEGLTAQTEAIVRYERPSGSDGENAAIDHIVDTLQAEGVPVDVYTFTAYTSDPISATVRVPAGNVSLEAITLSFSGSVEALDAPLVDMGTLNDLPDIELGTGERMSLVETSLSRGADPKPLPDPRGAIALVTGQPRNIPVAVLAMMGARAIVFANPEERLNDLIVTSTWGTPSLSNYHRLPAIPVAQVKKSGGDLLRDALSRGPVRVNLSTRVDTGWKPLRLAVARVPAADPNAPFVLFGGHIDAWYHGGTDEGASNAAMVELAKAFYRQRAELRRGLVVAWWPGHSNARYGGSTWFSDRFFDELRTRAVAYVNVDGIGQMGARRYGAASSSSLAGLAESVVKERVGVEIRPGRPGRNSDQSFNGIGLPLLQINHSRVAEDGGYWWWHTPEDTLDKVDFDVLKSDTDLYADALSSLLSARVLPLDLTAEVEAIGVALDRLQERHQAHFDLSEATRRQQVLLDLARQVDEATKKAADVVDMPLVRILRPLHRVLYVPTSPYHPDSGAVEGLLPGLAPLEILATELPDSNRYRFADTTVKRELNRLLEALDAATEAARQLLSNP